jgi:hypothetical protein
LRQCSPKESFPIRAKRGEAMIASLRRPLDGNKFPNR